MAGSHWSPFVRRNADRAANHKDNTLTGLCNRRPTWVANAPKKFDTVVFAACGWDPAMSDDQLLESLLALNQLRAPNSR